MKTNYRKWIKVIFVFIGMIAIFDFIDFLIHGLNPEYAVPNYYYRNKAIYGFIFAFITYLFVKNKKPFVKALIISGVTCVLLQMNYLFSGYSIEFVVEFLVIHFVILLPISWLTFKYILKH